MMNELWMVLLIASAVAGLLSLMPITRPKSRHEADTRSLQEAETAF